MHAKIVFVNTTSRLVAARLSEDKYVVFEYFSADVFQVGELLRCECLKFGSAMCERKEAKVRTEINILSPSMSFVKAKLVVAPWQNARVEDLAV